MASARLADSDGDRGVADVTGGVPPATLDFYYLDG